MSSHIPYLIEAQSPSQHPHGAAWLIGVVGVIALIVVIWKFTRSFLRPQDVFEIRDTAISWLEFFRSLGGLVITIAVGIHYSGEYLTLKDFIAHWADTLLVGAGCVAAWTMLFLIISDYPNVLIKRFGRPLLRMLLVAMFWLIIPPLDHWSRLNAILASNPNVTNYSVSDLLIVFAAAFIVFTAIASYCCGAMYQYGTGEMHPLFGPAVTVITTTVLMIFGLLPNPAHMPSSIEVLWPGSGRIPSYVNLTMTIAGWLTATCFSIIEWIVIKRRYPEITIQRVPANGSAISGLGRAL